MPATSLFSISLQTTFKYIKLAVNFPSCHHVVSFLPLLTFFSETLRTFLLREAQSRVDYGKTVAYRFGNSVTLVIRLTPHFRSLRS